MPNFIFIMTPGSPAQRYSSSSPTKYLSFSVNFMLGNPAGKLFRCRVQVARLSLIAFMVALLRSQG